MTNSPDLACPYCDKQLADERSACCGEVGHAVRLCEDCPPQNYPTDETRCDPCPRRRDASPPTDEKGIRDYATDAMFLLQQAAEGRCDSVRLSRQQASALYLLRSSFEPTPAPAGYRYATDAEMTAREHFDGVHSGHPLVRLAPEPAPAPPTEWMACSFATPADAILRIDVDGRLFWREREISTDQELREAMRDVAAMMRAQFSPEPRGSADEPQAVLLDKSLRQYAHDMRIAACGAWSAVAKPPIELDEAKCQLAAANEERLRKVIDELADLSKPSEPRDDGDWLWCQLMDWCKHVGSSPSMYNDLFKIVGRLRERQQPQIKEPT